MKDRKSGQSAVEWIVIVGITGFLLAVLGWLLYPRVFGNKQLIDFKQQFNVAYVLGDDSKFVRHEIKAWNDYENSDSVQVILKDGTTIYTHLRNVKLVKESK